MRLVQRQVGHLLANYAARADRGAGGRRRRSKARVRCDDGHGEDRHSRDQGGTARVRLRSPVRAQSLFALLNMSLANAYIVNWDAKYTYSFWRPVTAIRNGDQDGNDATERDAAWTSLIPTPLHPEYPSQATINAMIASAILESVFGPLKVIPFTATDVRDPKRTRQFASLADMAEEQKNVRVWGGVHYRFAIRTSEDLGPKVAAYMIENTLKPVR